MSKKEKTIEIPLDVARAYAVDHTPGNIADLQRAIKDALPKSREERLGLPWGGPEQTVLQGWRVPVSGSNYDYLCTCNKDQAKLIAHAPEMAELMESMALDDYYVGAAKARVLDLLRQAGWLEE